MIAERVAMAVRLTDKATLPFASDEIKLEILPPGHAATSIIPKAIVGVIKFLNMSIIINVTAGRKKNWEKNPIIVALGLRATFLKCPGLISSATPNMIKARVRFRINKLSWVKFRCMLSRTCRDSRIINNFIIGNR